MTRSTLPRSRGSGAKLYAGRSLRRACTRQRCGPIARRSCGQPMAATSNDVAAWICVRRFSQQPSGEACDELCELQPFAKGRLRAAALLRAYSRGTKPAEDAHVCQNCGPPRAEASARRTYVRCVFGSQLAKRTQQATAGGFVPPHLRAMRVRVAAREAHATSNRSRPTKKAGFAETKPAVLVELPGFEPRIPEPKSDVLPLHHSSIRCSKAGQRYTIFFNWQPRSPFFARGFFGRNPTGHQQSCGVGSEQVPTRNRLDKRPPRKVFPAEPPRTSLSRKLPTPVWP